MLTKILVPLDGSLLAEQALTSATSVARRTGASVLLVRAALSHTLIGVDPRERQAGSIEAAAEYLARVAARLEEQGIAVDVEVPFGHPQHCVPEQARLQHADMIMMSTHGRTGPGRWVFGSVAEAIVANSSVPVLVDRSWASPTIDTWLPSEPRFIVPLDGSEFAEAALATAAGLATDLGGELILIRAEDTPTMVGEALAYLASVKTRLNRAYPALEVRTGLRMGEPRYCIDEAVYAYGAALVVMATHGRTGILRSVTGSVAGQILQDGTAPLMLVRPPVEAESYDLAVGAAAIEA